MNKTILVTGSSRGIGKGIALSLAEAGYSVAINFRGNHSAAEETLVQCRKLAKDEEQKFEMFRADISNHEECSLMLEQIYKKMGDIDGLVNNAGMAPEKRVDLMDLEVSAFNRLMSVNLEGPLFLTQSVASRWIDSKKDLSGKTIIFVTSVSAEMVSVNRAEYCISKAGLSMVTQLFAVRLAEEGILVYEVRPGIIQTDMTSGVQDKYDRLISEGLVPQKRWGLPEDIGNCVCSLVGGAMAFSTGAVIRVDGGLNIPRL